MDNVVKKGVATGVALLLAFMVAYGLVKTAPAPERVEFEEVATTIRVMAVQRSDVQLEVISQGSVVPQIKSELVPEVNGRVKWVSPNLVAGGYFSEGEVLLRIDDQDYSATVARSKATLTRAEAEEELARFELKRMEELVKRRLTSQSSLESILRNHRIALASLEDARIALDQAHRDLRRTEIRAPYDGLVRTQKVNVGQYLGRGDSIASIYASGSIEVRLPVADRQLAYLDLPLGYRGELASTPEVILFTNYGGKHYEWVGKLVRTEAEIDAKSRMVTAVARVVNDDDRQEQTQQPSLPVGLFVNARIKGRWARDVAILPRAALRDQTQVLVVSEDNRLHFRQVEILRFDQDNVIIQSGLQTGELVNISPIQVVVEGMRVNPIIEAGLPSSQPSDKTLEQPSEQPSGPPSEPPSAALPGAAGR